MDNLSLDLINVCRCCLAKNTKLKPIFNSFGNMSQVIFLFTAVKIEEGDNLPATICLTCISNLNKCINFKRQVESTDFLLRKLYSNSQKGLNNNSHDHDYAKPKNCFINNFDECNSGYRDEDWPSSSSLNSYSSELNKRMLSCIQCGKKFKDKISLDNHVSCHIVSNSTKAILTCPTCEDNFTVKEDLFVHSSLHDVANGFICKSCNKQFSTHFKLKRHVPSHFHDKPYKCKICQLGFTEMASLTRHFRVHTGTKPISAHSCSNCNKSFPNRYTLKVHYRSHTGERPWKCNGCEKQFSDFRLLNSHKRLHDERKPYKCNECKKRHHSTLATHLRVHTNSNRPYRCDKCKKSFKQSWRLQLHKRQSHISLNNRRFLCDQCSQVFTSTASLEDHLKWHSKKVEVNNDDGQKEAPCEFFQCNECSAQFSSRLDLITHQKLTHALRHECDTCFGKWKTLTELVRHKCNEALKASNEPTPDEMILLPNGEMQDCNTIVDSLLASVLQRGQTTTAHEKENSKSGEQND